jgi:hypothetical protein
VKIVDGSALKRPYKEHDMGGGGGILSPITNAVFGKPQTVDTPNYSQAAQDTAAGNLANAQATTIANRVNQNTPYGSLNYVQGTDANGNPTWTANQTASPQLGSAINSNLGNLASTYSQNYQAPAAYQPLQTPGAYQAIQAPTFSTGGDLASMGYYGSRLNAQQLDPNSLKALPQYDVNTQINRGALPSYGINPGQSYSDAIMQRLQPSLARQSASSDVQLANQGIMPGSEAYNTAKTLLSQNQNDALTSAIVGGMNVGLQANQQAYGQEAGQIGLNLQGQGQNFNQGIAGNQQYMGANQQAYQQQLANQQLGMQAQNQAFNQTQAQNQYGLGAQNQAYNQVMGQNQYGLGAQNQAFNQGVTQYNMPMATAQGLQGLASPSNFVSPYNQQMTGGADQTSAMMAANQSNQANANAQNAQNNAMMSGLFKLGGASLMSPTGTFTNMFS